MIGLSVLIEFTQRDTTTRKSSAFRKLGKLSTNSDTRLPSDGQALPKRYTSTLFARSLIENRFTLVRSALLNFDTSNSIERGSIPQEESKWSLLVVIRLIQDSKVCRLSFPAFLEMTLRQ
jgi:hypothetical protein